MPPIQAGCLPPVGLTQFATKCHRRNGAQFQASCIGSTRNGDDALRSLSSQMRGLKRGFNIQCSVSTSNLAARVANNLATDPNGHCFVHRKARVGLSTSRKTPPLFLSTSFTLVVNQDTIKVSILNSINPQISRTKLQGI